MPKAKAAAKGKQSANNGKKSAPAKTTKKSGGKSKKG
jgi:hypothetical protein